MIRSDLANKLAQKLDISKQEADRILLTFVEGIMSNLEKEGRVVIQGFGSFRVREYPARIGKKPVTGEPIEIPARKKPVFHASKELNALINREGKEVPIARVFVESAPLYVQRP
ncbi:DNA-binding protein HU-1 (modular protein) [Nitrospina gracilis 3/211]|uniref:DNA-binding protein HU-1 (Modular protein) n=1 Tax=Nitrospina gracilis (strain 3/211) TaxID=1266370 RepID=M1YUL8_NITG3|nr:MULTISPECIES: HU family DNA-binding protein [Nitrospina]MCF8722094.1 nucleoid DNA-binding protein [Nitrospina sp. Nb-3]CCQ89283.1 DNA-binding protein HU-1 (modular protein) [Nitrospina gracilis 3/211]